MAVCRTLKQFLEGFSRVHKGSIRLCRGPAPWGPVACGLGPVYCVFKEILRERLWFAGF